MGRPMFSKSLMHFSVDGQGHVSSLLFESESGSVVSDSLQPHGIYSPWNSPGQDTGVDSLSLLQGIFPTQGSNPCLPHCRWILYHHTTEEVLYTAMSVRVQISLRYLVFISFRYILRSEIAGPYGSSTCHMVVTKCGLLEKGMANHFSILALRTP